MDVKNFKESTLQQEGFNHPVFGGLRVFMKDDQPWFMYSEVSTTLELHKDLWYYGDGVKKNRKHHKGDAPPDGGVTSKKTLRYNMSIDGVDTIQIIDAMGRKQKPTIVNEVNLYRMIFASQKPNALDFQKWVANEVLPTIRKQGRYVDPYHNDIGNGTHGGFTFQEFSANYCQHKPLCLGRNKVMRILRDNNVLTAENLPFRKYIDNGWFIREPYVDNNNKTRYATTITNKGVNGLLRIIKQHYLDRPKGNYNPNQLRLFGEVTDGEYYKMIS